VSRDFEVGTNVSYEESTVSPRTRLILRLSGLILLPQYFTNGLSNFDKTDREYSLRLY